MSPSILSVLPPLPPRVYLRRPRRPLPFPLEEPNCRIFSLGRHCLWHGLATLELAAGDEVLVPAYHHGSEVEVFLRAGLECRFYEGGETLEPDSSELEGLLTERTRALVLTHYMGFPQDAGRWRAWCDERGLFLIEDGAQSWLAADAGRPIGAWGDVAIFCLYKTYGLPDGACLISRAPALSAPQPDTLGFPSLFRRHARWVVMRSSLLADLGSRLQRPQPYDPDEDFILGDPASPAMRATHLLVPRISDVGAAAKRRENYQMLLEKLPGRAPAPFDRVPSGASPHAFPVATDRAGELVDRLAGRGIRAFKFWSFAHPALPEPQFPGAASRRRTTVVLPAHQDLREKDIDRIAAATLAAGG
jgi:dTDP-4-amino-4,6-dideoxygalactose transaminase